MKVRGWLGGAMVLGKLPVPGGLTYFGNSRARDYCAGGVYLDIFLSSIISPVSTSLGDISIQTEKTISKES